jgi:sulfatase modifying factor 1
MTLIRFLAALIVAFLPSAAVAATITIDTVPVGDVGNPNDPGTGNHYGGVNYAYNIGKYEVTVGQYAAFLNAVAATDTYALYNSKMATEPHVAGISQSGSSGSYTYSVIGSANHPIAYVSWGDAARFANWLQNGQPTGAQNASTTEDGAYTLNGATIPFTLNSVSRNTGARWFIPTENEWYKAAYYQPVSQGGDSDSYWSYAMKTNSTPYSDQPPGVTPDNTRVANFSQDDGQANGYSDGYAVTGSTSLSAFQNYLTDVGAYASSPSFYGTFDQGGNVWEWTDTDFRVIRGGSWQDSFLSLSASARSSSSLSNESDHNGFRVASIPEPSTAALIGLAAVALFNTRRRRA